MKKEDLEIIDGNILGFGYPLTSYLDHTAILSWINFMSHKCDVGKENVNFDNREFIRLPSGQKVKITIKVESV